MRAGGLSCDLQAAGWVGLRATWDQADRSTSLYTLGCPLNGRHGNSSGRSISIWGINSHELVDRSESKEGECRSEISAMYERI